MLDLQNSYNNRRIDARIPCFQRTHFVDGNGTQYRTEVLNVSRGGAKLTTHNKVKVGDTFELIDQERNSKAKGSLVEVRWTTPLPGGVRLVAGVKRLVI